MNLNEKVMTIMITSSSLYLIYVTRVFEAIKGYDII
jgi:hypothetical protein